MQSLIVDCNISIDFASANIITAVIEGAFKIITPLIIYESELTSFDTELVDLRLITIESNQESRTIVKTLCSEYPGLSEPDLYTLVLASKLGYTLLTGDKLLRISAKKWRIEVHGTLWLIEQLARSKVLSRHDAASGLELMLKRGRRLPEKETRLLIEDLRNQDT